MKSFKTKVITNYETIIKDIGNDLSIIFKKKNKKFIEYYICKTDTLKYGENCLKSSGDKFHVYQIDILDKIKIMHFCDIHFYQKQLTTENVFEMDKIDVKIILRSASHLVYNVNSDYPLSGVYHYSCCNFVERNFDIDNLKKHFENHKFVLSVKEEVIPYYNANFYKERNLLVKIRLDQEIFNKCWDEALKLDKCPSCRIKYIIEGDYSDPLNINKFKKDKPDERSEY